MGAFLLCSAAFLCRHDYHGEPFFAEAPFAGVFRLFRPHSGKAQAFPLRHMKAACIAARLCKKACPRKPRPAKNAAFPVLPEKPHFRGCSHGEGEPSTPEQPSACGGCSHGEQRPCINARFFLLFAKVCLVSALRGPRPAFRRPGRREGIAGIHFRR